MRAQMVVTWMALAACATQRGTDGHASAPPAASRSAEAAAGAGGMAQMCPMAVPGTHVAAVDTADGVALDFTTSGDAGELQRRVRAMADMHNRHHAGDAAGGGHRGMHGSMMHGGTMGHGGTDGAEAEGGGAMGGTRGGDGGSHERMVPQSAQAAVEDVERGARIVLTPRSGEQLATLRAHVHEHAMAMERSGTCPMMQMGGSGEPGAHGHAG